MLTTEERENLAYTPHITLNGVPAVVCGLKLDFPVVRSLNGLLQAEYSWATVKYVIEHLNGNFKI